jgi:hypothetical protein
MANTDNSDVLRAPRLTDALDVPTKPAPSYAPIYCAMYPELATIARDMGYALAIHGSLQRDFDLVCIPWAETAADPDAVIAAFCARFAIRVVGVPETKLHGRVAWSISVAWGECAIDISFMPRDADGGAA